MSKSVQTNEITLPNVDVLKVCEEHREIYLRFMKHIRHVPISRMEIKILSAIQFTADMTGSSDAHIAKELVDMGLRAPRMAFPIEFLDYADRTLMRCGWDVGAPNEALIALRDMWFSSRPQMQLASFRHVHGIIKEDVLEG